MTLFVGLMSGTSTDGIDAALVDLSAQTPALVATHEHPIPPSLRRALLAFSSGELNDVTALATLDSRMGHLFASAVVVLLEKMGVRATAVRAIGSHGHTVRHVVSGADRYSLQIGDPNIIAELTGITTVADFRRRDVAAGGGGAPLAPAFHAAVLRHTARPRAVVNIGGIANITVLPADPAAPIIGFDSGPGNGLIDAWTSRHLGKPMDRDGRWASEGTVDAALLAALLDEPYFAEAPPKSTGREMFHLGWVERRIAASGSQPSAQTTQRTLCALTVAAIANALEHYAPDAGEVLVCGGGVHNPVLMDDLAERLPERHVASTAAHGLDPDWVEAIAFAWLAKRTLDGLPGNLPSVTGATHPVVLGGIYPGGLQKTEVQR